MPPIRSSKRDRAQQPSAMTERMSTLRLPRPKPSLPKPSRPKPSPVADTDTTGGFNFPYFNLKLGTLPKLDWVPRHSHPGLYPGQIVIDDPNTVPKGAVPLSNDRPGAWRCPRNHGWEDVWNSSARSTCAVCATSRDKMTTDTVASWDTPDAGFATYEGVSVHYPMAIIGQLPKMKKGKHIGQRQARMRYLLLRQFPAMTTLQLRPYWLRHYVWESEEDFVEVWGRLGEGRVRRQVPDDLTQSLEQNEEDDSMLDAEEEGGEDNDYSSFEEEDQEEEDQSSLQDDEQAETAMSSSEQEQPDDQELADGLDELLLITWDEVQTMDAKLRQIRQLRRLYGHDARLLRDQVKRHAGAGLYLPS